MVLFLLLDSLKLDSILAFMRCCYVNIETPLSLILLCISSFFSFNYHNFILVSGSVPFWSEYLGSSIAHQLLGENAAETAVIQGSRGNLFLGSKSITGYENEGNYDCYNTYGEAHRSI